jgi:hypothetical protein
MHGYEEAAAMGIYFFCFYAAHQALWVLCVLCLVGGGLTGSWFQGVLLYSSLVIVSWGRMRGDQSRRPTRTKMSLATDSNAAAATQPLMKKLRGVQLLHNGCQQELDAAAMYSRCGSKQKRTQNSK